MSFNEINNDILDYPIYMEQNLHDLPVSSGNLTPPSDINQSDITGFFSNQLIHFKSLSITNVSKGPTTQLKTAKYGEVLTTDEVLTRLEEAEFKKSVKQKKGPRGRQKNISELEIENKYQTQVEQQIYDDLVEKTMEIELQNQSFEKSCDDVAHDV